MPSSGGLAFLLARFFAADAADPDAVASSVSAAVDLLGRLSNPPETLTTIAGQGVERARESRDEPPKQPIGSRGLRIRRSRGSWTALKPALMTQALHRSARCSDT